MRKIFLSLLLTSTLWAMPTHSPNRATYFHDDESCFDPCDPCFLWQEALSWRIGYQGDFVFNRYMERRQNLHNGSDIKTVSFVTNGGDLTLNAADWFEFYTVLGATKFSIQTPSTENGQMGELFFSPRLSWQIGMRGTAWMYKKLALGFQGGYFRTSPKLDAYLDYGVGEMTYFNNSQKPTFWEWSASCGLSYPFEGPGSLEFIPHIAAVASGAKMALHGKRFVNGGTTYTFLNLKDTRMWGYTFGLNLEMNPLIAVGIEAHFGDQKALHLIGEVAF